MTGDNEPWDREGWTLPPRHCGEFQSNPHQCSICGDAVTIPANIILGSE